MVTSKIKVLVVGCGSIGRRHARVLRQLGVTDIGLCDPFEANLREALSEIGSAQTFSSYEDVLTHNFDAVIICTPPRLHITQALVAVEAGCHVLTEKPLSINLAGIVELNQKAQSLSRLVMVALCFRYHAGVRLVKQMIEERQIGRLVSVRAEIGENLAEARPNIDYRKLYVTAKEVGVALDHCHEPDFVQWIVNQPIKRITAFTARFSDLEMLGDDIAEMVLEFEGRVLANIHRDFFQPVRRRIGTYLGTQGTIVMDMADWHNCYIDIYRTATSGWQKQVLAMGRDDMFRAMDGKFLDCIASRREPSINLAEGTKSLQIALSAKASNQQNC